MLGTFGTKKNKSVEVSRGFKIQFESRDGRYNCVDMDIEDNNNIRPVNINTTKWLIIGGTKYVVE